jgi:hypothetical protein
MATKTTKKPTAQEQGFPAVYLGEGGKFKPGHDMRAKSDLIGAILGTDAPGRLHVFTKADAEKLVKARGWEGNVAAARRKVMERAKAEAAKAKETEAAAA